MADGEAMAEGRQAISGLWRLLAGRQALAALARAPVEAMAQAPRGPAGWQLALLARTEHSTSITMNEFSSSSMPATQHYNNHSGIYLASTWHESSMQAAVHGPPVVIMLHSC